MAFRIVTRSHNYHHYLILNLNFKFLTRKRKPVSLKSSLSCGLAATNPLLSLWICFFWRVHRNGIIQSVAFCFFHLAQCFQSSHVTVLHSSLWLDQVLLYSCTTFYVSSHQLKNIWVFSPFQQLCIMLL